MTRKQALAAYTAALISGSTSAIIAARQALETAV